ncbi:MAG: ATP-binding cassette domain-containing protein [Planctomycetales bacterium]
MTVLPAIGVERLSYRYGEVPALDDVSCAVQPGEIFGLLGPNGGGKTTLFRLISTLLPIQSGRIHLLGLDVAQNPAAVRQRIGVTFQSPSLDRKLTVMENLRCHGQLYGLRGHPLQERMARLMERLGVADRGGDRVESLSGGLARRVEIAKGLLHDPPLLLLDEPSTGLDPGARLDLWGYLRGLRDQAGVTVLVTTHLMDEAERCDRLAILDRGQIVALGSPEELRKSLGGDCLTIQTADPQGLSRQIAERFQVTPRQVAQHLRMEVERGHELIGPLMEAFGSQITSVALGKPTLEDVFVRKTGRGFWDRGAGE